MKKRTQKIPAGFFDRATVARMLGVSDRHFDSRWRKLLSGDDQVAIGKRPYFNTRALIDAMIAEAVQKDQESRTTDEDSLMVAGPNSPALERWREAKARIATADADERENLIVSRTLLSPIMRRVFGAISNAVFRVRQMGHNQAADLFEEVSQAGIEAIAISLEKGEFKPTAADGAAEQVTTTPATPEK